MLESIKVVAAIEVPPRRQPESANDDALRFARSCYDHLAGQVGVAVTDALVGMGHIVLTDEGGEVTSSGGRFLSAFGAERKRPPEDVTSPPSSVSTMCPMPTSASVTATPTWPAR